jgi:hypothetical protein
MMASLAVFKVGDAVRYKPGFGTYGYEDVLQVDGRIAAVVIGFSPTRVQIKFTQSGRLKDRTRAVDVKSLVRG